MGEQGRKRSMTNLLQRMSRETLLWSAVTIYYSCCSSCCSANLYSEFLSRSSDSLSLSLSLSLSQTLCLSLSLSVYDSLSLSLTLSLTFFLSLSLTIPLSDNLSLSTFLSLSLSLYIYIYAVKLLIGPSLGVFNVINWSKSKLLTGPRSFSHYKNRSFRRFVFFAQLSLCVFFVPNYLAIV